MPCTLTPDPGSGTQRDLGSDDFTEPFQLERKDVGDVVSELAETSGDLTGNLYVLRCLMSNGFVSVSLLDFSFMMYITACCTKSHRKTVIQQTLLPNK